MRINPYDKAEALKRSSQYRKDYNEYRKAYDLRVRNGEMIDVFIGSPGNFQIKLCPEGKKLCIKYEISIPIDPNGSINFSDFSYVTQPIITFLPPPNEWTQKTVKSFAGIDNSEQISHINDKLSILIDTSFTKEQIYDALDKFLNMHLKKNVERAGKSEFNDIWDIYDKKERDGKSLLEISRELCGINDLPAYNETLDAHYRKVSRAYKKAKDIIGFIETQSRSPHH